MTIQTPTQKKIIYSDFLASFGVNPNTNDITKIVNEQAVINSIKKILKTNYYEIPYNPLFGSNVNGLLFENFTATLATELKNEITLAITNFEPRVNLLDVSITSNPDGYTISATITFSIINNSQNTITITELLTRVR